MTSLWNLGSGTDERTPSKECGKGELVEAFSLRKSLSVVTGRSVSTTDQPTASLPGKKEAKSKKYGNAKIPVQENQPSSNLLSGILGVINISGDKAGFEIPNDEPPTLAGSLMTRFSSVGSKTSDNSQTKKVEETSTRLIKSNSNSTSLKGPSVYEEALEMLSAALLIYTFADLRKLAREGKIESKELMKQPIPIKKIVDAISAHRVALEELAVIDQNGLDARLKALKDIRKQQESSSSVMGRMLRGKKDTVLSHFHDEKSTQGMVYGMAVNHIRRRITIIFRGSVTQQDFITDVKLAQKKVDNPALYLAPETPKTINIHTGFYQYLFQKDDEGKVRLQHILEDVKTLMKKNKGYRLYCTGHSLGGALSSLCGFYAAMDENIVKNGPVVVVSIASPRVGNVEFRASFQALERLKRLQHLRVSNRDDLVTLLPFMALKEATLSPSLLAPTNAAINLYKHCGIHLKFKSCKPTDSDDERKLFSLTYAKDKNDEEGVLPADLRRSAVAAKSLMGSMLVTRADFRFHKCDEYERRLMVSKNFLDDISLDQLYADNALVGETVAVQGQEEEASSQRLFGKRKSSSGLKATSREAVTAACAKYVA